VNPLSLSLRIDVLSIMVCDQIDEPLATGHHRLIHCP
jgi:hypothetical protein